MTHARSSKRPARDDRTRPADTMHRFTPPQAPIGRSWRRTFAFARAWAGWRARAAWRTTQDHHAAVAEAAAAAFERLGGTSVLIARHLAYRVDLLSPEVCGALVDVDDRVAVPFPLEVALDQMTRAVRRPLYEVFAQIDPVPITVDCLSMVFQAILLSGERVAVRVVRPSAPRELVADIRAVHRLCAAADALTLVKAGYLDDLVEALRDLAEIELDLVMVVRYQEEFRRRVRDAGMRRYVDAARSHTALCSPSVTVSEFVSGILVSEVIAAQEHGDRELLGQLRVQPRRLARNLLATSWWMAFEEPFVVIDPQAESIVVQDGRRLVFTRLGHCENLPVNVTSAWRQVLHHMCTGDYSAAAVALTDAIEPFPYVDIELFAHAIEERLAHQLHAMRDEHAPPAERSSAGIWLALAEVAAANEVVLPPDLVRMMQASVCMEEIAIRLDPDLRVLREFRRYERRARRRRLRKLARAAAATTPLRAGAAVGIRVMSLIEEGRRTRAALDATFRRIPISTRLDETVPSAMLHFALTLAVRAATVTILIAGLAAGWRLGTGGDPPLLWLAALGALALALWIGIPARAALLRLGEQRERT